MDALPEAILDNPTYFAQNKIKDLTTDDGWNSEFFISQRLKTFHNT